MKLPKGILLKEIDVPELKTPAMFSRNRNTVYVNKTRFNKLSKPEQDFVICHELGHAETRNEIEADFLGFNRFMSLGYTPKQAVEALNNSLSFTLPEHNERFSEIIRNAATYDVLVNKNFKSLKIINMYTPGQENFTAEDYEYLKSRLEPMGVTEDDIQGFLGFGKKAQERRDARQAARLEKKAAKTNLINAKAEGIKAGTFKSGAGDIVNKLADTASSIFGKNTNADTEIENMDNGGADTSSSNTSTYVIVGVIVIVIVVIGIVMLKKKGK